MYFLQIINNFWLSITT